MDTHAKTETAKSDPPALGPEEILHGGDITRAEELYGVPADGWLDLSTGINPNPYPFSLGDIDAKAFSRLPLKKTIKDLQQAATAYYGAPDLDNVVAAPGTQALIQWLPRLKGHSRVAIIGPTYAEHARSWRSCGHTVVEITDLTQAHSDFDVVVVVNPNNPDGRTHDPEALLELHGHLAARGGWLVVDEAFADVTPEISLAPHCGAEALVVLRSYGKFFGLAGLRLGFALTGNATAHRLTEALGPWAVPEPAAIIATQSFRDGKWIADTRDDLSRAQHRLKAVLVREKINIVGATGLFTLVQLSDAQALHAHLAKRGIWTRIFPENPAWLRFGMPGKTSDWERLSAALGRY